MSSSVKRDKPTGTKHVSGNCGPSTTLVRRGRPRSPARSRTLTSPGRTPGKCNSAHESSNRCSDCGRAARPSAYRLGCSKKRMLRCVSDWHWLRARENASTLPLCMTARVPSRCPKYKLMVRREACAA